MISACETSNFDMVFKFGDFAVVVVVVVEKITKAILDERPTSAIYCVKYRKLFGNVIAFTVLVIHIFVGYFFFFFWFQVSSSGFHSSY